MKIGPTYDLCLDYLDLGYGEEETAEFDSVETVKAIEKGLQSLGYETDRIGNIWSLTGRLVVGDRWDMVFNIAEGLRGIGREAQVPALLDAYAIPYTFSDPLILALTLHKGMTKRVLRDMGVATPDFAEVASEEDIAKVRLPYPLFAKPIAEGTGKGIHATSKITDAAQLRSVCLELLSRYRQPVLVETFLPGREFTVGVVGTGERTEVLGVMEILLRSSAESDVYSYTNKEECDSRVDYLLVTDPEAQSAAETARKAWIELGCRDAGRIDLRVDGSGTVNLMELNPLAGIHPQHSDLPIICNLAGIPYIQLLERIMESALERVRHGSGTASGQSAAASVNR